MFAPMAKMTIVYTIIVFTASKGWPIPHMDVRNEFLYSLTPLLRFVL